MRRSSRIVFVLFALAGAATSSLFAQNPPSVDDIVAKNIQAKGGADKLKGVKTTRITGRLIIQGNEVPMTIVTKRPNLLRQELSVQGQTVIQAYDGATAWTVNPMMGSDQPVELPAAQAKSLADQADSEPALLDYKAKGTKVELAGSEDVDGKKTTHLIVTKKSGQVIHYYIDPETGLEARVAATAPTPDGQQGRLTSDLSNYREVDGMMVPFTLKQGMNGTPIAQLSVEKIEFNVLVDDAIFKMPKK